MYLLGKKPTDTGSQPPNKKGEYVDILCSPNTLLGVSGYGTVHHVAFATPTITTQGQAREKLMKYGLDTTRLFNQRLSFDLLGARRSLV